MQIVLLFSFFRNKIKSLVPLKPPCTSSALLARLPLCPLASHMPFLCPVQHQVPVLPQLPVMGSNAHVATSVNRGAVSEGSTNKGEDFFFNAPPGSMPSTRSPVASGSSVKRDLAVTLYHILRAFPFILFPCFSVVTPPFFFPVVLRFPFLRNN